ncbi:radical SAM protein [uncultured Desulfosarcina sp.]|uniref:radical SAM protein n=1 Tax=uncultured Desulfosarcina sp. TaxID=218289 RepID=UPI0029C95318|nr:radical SAM protein [uncultured Desulfosarcina sp.]
MKSNQETKQNVKKKSGGHGTQEWSVKTVNCVTGCSHNCLYCYAKGMAVRFKQVTPEEWPIERVRPHDVAKRHRMYSGQVMFPSSHDITPYNLVSCIKVLKKLLIVGNRVLVVSKPHIQCIEKLCEELAEYRDKILFRFTIGAQDNKILSYWEPNSPSYVERRASLVHAYDQGFKTSVSVEPMLDATNIDDLISDLSPYVTDAIWIGTMNHLGRFGKSSDVVMKQAIAMIRRGQTNASIRAIYRRHKDNPLIKWKKEIKKVVGIPIPKQNGLDI